MPWIKGQSGNPGGRAKGYAEIEALARSYATEALDALRAALSDPKLKVAAATALLDRGFGRPAQKIDANISILDGLQPNELAVIEATLAAIAGNPDDVAARGATTH